MHNVKKINEIWIYYSKVYNYLDTVGRGYKPRQRGWGGAATLQNVNLFLDFTIKGAPRELGWGNALNRQL